MEDLKNHTGTLHIKSLPDGRHELQCDVGITLAHSHCITDYPLELIKVIFDEFGAGYTVDEIMRDQDNNDAQLDVRYSVLSYFPDDILARKLRILDYGCGSGSSILALNRVFPNADITGLDHGPQYLKIAGLRARHFGLHNIELQQVPSAGTFSLQGYDFAFLNAVYEHLLPDERPEVMKNIWHALKPGGALILNQTPHRWFPIETHTSGLPLINYLPDSLTHHAVNKFSKRSSGKDTWPQLLRAGVRGATVGEIMRDIHRIDPGAKRLQPIRIANSWAGIWYAAKRKRMREGAFKTAVTLTQKFVDLTRFPLSPYVNIAVRKS